MAAPTPEAPPAGERGLHARIIAADGDPGGATAQPLVFPGEGEAGGRFPPFAAGFERCRSARLSGTGGIEIAHVVNLDPGALDLSRHNAADRIVVAVTLGSQVADVRLDSRMVRSGALPPGCATIEQPSQSGAIRTRGRWDTLFFFLPTAMVGRLCQVGDLEDGPGSAGLRNSPTRSDPVLLQLARRVRAEIAAPTPFARLRADSLAQDTVIHLILGHPGRARARGGLSPGQLRRACEAMDALLEQDVTLEALATVAGCSPTHFSRAFKQSTGLPPFQWLLNRRIERARRLLLERDTSIAEIAQEVGFAAQPQFTTAFRRITGTTPAAYRRAKNEHDRRD